MSQMTLNKIFGCLVAGCLMVVGLTAATAVTEEDADAPAAPEPTIVTSERLQVDYLHNMGTFEGNVLVVDPRITVRADKMVVFFGAAHKESVTNRTATTEAPAVSTNLTAQSLQKIEAHGGVVITQADKKAESEHAVYTAADGRVVLTGNPRLDGPDGMVSGEKITFWRDDKRVDIESGTRLILFPEEPQPPLTEDVPPPAPSDDPASGEPDK